MYAELNRLNARGLKGFKWAMRRSRQDLKFFRNADDGFSLRNIHIYIYILTAYLSTIILSSENTLLRRRKVPNYSKQTKEFFLLAVWPHANSTQKIQTKIIIRTTELAALKWYYRIACRVFAGE